MVIDTPDLCTQCHQQFLCVFVLKDVLLEADKTETGRISTTEFLRVMRMKQIGSLGLKDADLEHLCTYFAHQVGWRIYIHLDSKGYASSSRHLNVMCGGSG